MKIMYRRTITFPGIAVATVVGVVGGVYIYKPMFRPPNKNVTHSAMNQDEESVDQSGDNKTKQVTSD
ncbi:protein PIGBOS1 [Conger conger]|uniref:protein PIGBOS1 n=1 Tax=Conger conger TaxID=82655 RepID=UPI002A598D4D|nr:protein PIGBOS1 [Conger conger]